LNFRPSPTKSKKRQKPQLLPS